MAKFNFINTPIEGLYIIEPTVFGDSRGYFMETYNQAEFEFNKLNIKFVQDNESKSGKGVLRGLHFQKTNLIFRGQSRSFGADGISRFLHGSGIMFISRSAETGRETCI